MLHCDTLSSPRRLSKTCLQGVYFAHLAGLDEKMAGFMSIITVVLDARAMVRNQIGFEGR